jgi:hypothetical protein
MSEFVASEEMHWCKTEFAWARKLPTGNKLNSCILALQPGLV